MDIASHRVKIHAEKVIKGDVLLLDTAHMHTERHKVVDVRWENSLFPRHLNEQLVAFLAELPGGERYWTMAFYPEDLLDAEPRRNADKKKASRKNTKKLTIT